MAQSMEETGHEEKVLIVVDMQEDFVSGSLGTKEAQAIVPRVAEKPPILMERSFSPSIPMGLITSNAGRQDPSCAALHQRNGWSSPCAGTGESGGTAWRGKVEKEAFGSLALAGKLEKVRDTIESVELVGLCTDICVVSNALIIKAALPEVPVLVDSHCCAGVTPHSHGAALETMRSSQVKIL